MDHPRRDADERDLLLALLLIFADWSAVLRASVVPETRRIFIAWQFFRDRVVEVLRQRLERVALFAYLLWLGTTDVAPNQTRAAEQFATWAANHAGLVGDRLLKNVQERYAQLLAAVAVGQAQPDDIGDLVTPQRAEGIAITEVTRAFQAGIEGAVKAFEAQHGVRVEKFWQTKRDAKVCPICGPLDGQPKVVWGLLFPDGPPAHPFCRCHLKLKIPPHGQPV